MKKVRIQDKIFELSVKARDIQVSVDKVAKKMNRDLEGKDVVFVCVLNGAFMFASDLLKKVKMNCLVTFVKLTSYKGTQQTGNVTSLIGLNEDIMGKTVVIIEDIVDTGETIENLMSEILKYKPGEVKIAAFLLKPESYKNKLKINYICIKIPDNFVIGYGLDYNGYGRNLKNIYKFTKNSLE